MSYNETISNSLMNVTNTRHVGLTGSAIVVVLSTNTILCGIGIAVWWLLCRNMDLYQKKFPRPADKDPGPAPSSSAEWLHDLLFSTKTVREIAAAYGVETGLYLLFQKYLVMMLAAICVLTNTILLPIHLTGGELTDLRFSYNTTGNRTIVEVVEDNLFKASQLANAMHNPYRLMAHVLVAYAVMAVVVYLCWRYVMASQEVDFRRAIDCIENHTIRVNNMPKWVTIHDLPDVMTAIKNQLGTDAVTLHVAFDVARRVEMGQALRRVNRRLQCATAAIEEKGVQYHVYRCGGCRKQESREYYMDQKEKLCLAISEWEQRVEQDIASVKCAGFAHLVVDSTLTAQRLLQTKPQLQYEYTSLYLVPASHPKDCEWAFVGTAMEEKMVRRALIWAMIIVFCFFFSTPASILSGLQNIVTEVPAIDSFLHSLGLDSPSFRSSLLYQYLPSLIMLSITVLLPMLLEYMTELEKRSSRRAYKRMVGTRIYGYLLLSVFLMPSLVLTTVKQFIDRVHVQQGISAGLRMSFIAGDGSVFANYVIQMMTFANLSDLWRFSAPVLHAPPHPSVTPHAPPHALPCALPCQGPCLAPPGALPYGLCPVPLFLCRSPCNAPCHAPCYAPCFVLRCALCRGPCQAPGHTRCHDRCHPCPALAIASRRCPTRIGFGNLHCISST